jgi:hypothetical protein
VGVAVGAGVEVAKRRTSTVVEHGVTGRVHTIDLSAGLVTAGERLFVSVVHQRSSLQMELPRSLRGGSLDGAGVQLRCLSTTQCAFAYYSI